MALSEAFVGELRSIVGSEGVVVSHEGRMVYECDMHTLYKGMPDAVVLPEWTEQVVEVVRRCRLHGVPVVPRGAGTGLIGGAMAPRGGVMVGLNRMDAVLEIDLANRCATVQPGLINLWLTRAVADRGYYFAPDPSSQMVASIGGNVATNAGGAHCLKYGITTNHVLGLELVTGRGELVRVGGKVADRPGYDLTGVTVGSEGTFGLVTAVTVRLRHVPEAVKTVLASFGSLVAASHTVSRRCIPPPRLPCCSSSSTAPGPRWTARASGVRRCPGSAAPSRCVWRGTTPSGPCSGRAARRRPARWVD
jgi:glycolate oxidase